MKRYPDACWRHQHFQVLPIHGYDNAVRQKKSDMMWCAVLDRGGDDLPHQATDTNKSPGTTLLTDAWLRHRNCQGQGLRGSRSSNDTALSSFEVGLAARADGGGGPTMVGHDFGPAPSFGLGNTNPWLVPAKTPGLAPNSSIGLKHRGIVTFAGGEPVHDCSGHKLLGGVGASGNGASKAIPWPKAQ